MAPMVPRFVRGNVHRIKAAGRYIRTTRTPALGGTGDMHSGLDTAHDCAFLPVGLHGPVIRWNCEPAAPVEQR